MKLVCVGFCICLLNFVAVFLRESKRFVLSFKRFD